MRSFIKTVATVSLISTALYGGVRGALRARTAWKNMKVIQSVDTGSVWTTE